MADLKNTTPASHPALPHSDSASSTPGFLRLPTELRLHIYDILSADQRCKYALPYKDKISLSPRLFTLPIAHVCQQLRYETIQHFYSKLWWEVLNAKGVPEEKWLRRIDPLALMCMRGVRLRLRPHECLDPGRLTKDGFEQRCGVEKWIEVPFDNGSVTLTTCGDRKVTCAVGLLSNKRRIMAAENYVKAIKIGRNEVKKRLGELLTELEDIAITTKVHKE